MTSFSLANKFMIKSSFKPIWIIIPVHNRRLTTQACLEKLKSLGYDGVVTVCLVDDLCTDGTGEMVDHQYPWVHRILGNGNLFWGGGIMMGMKEAYSHGAEIMVWLNDDCQPHHDAIDLLINRVRETHGICGGVCFNPENLAEVTYSGTIKGSQLPVKPVENEYVTVDMINGNLVAIHREVVDRIGFPPGDTLPHYGGDSIYALRARRSGIPCEVYGSAKATNAPNPYFERFGTSKPAWWLLKEPFRTASILYWPTYWRFLREAFGLQAFVRWPFYILRLIRLLLIAFSLQHHSSSKP